MNNFEYFNPVKIIFGKNEIAKLSKLIPKNQKVLVTYGGGSIKNNGIYEQVMSALEDHEKIEFSGIMPNPQYENLMNAVELAKKENIDFFLAVGGGSVIDATKFIAAAVHHDDDPWKILSERQPIKNVTKMGVVLTLPATGSEMNSFSVISRGDKKLGFGGDPRLYPTFSILDPEVTYSLPEKQLGNGIVDAFVHVIEQYLTTSKITPIQDRFAESILKTLIEEAPKVIEVKNDYESRANLMWSATQALNGLIGVGVDHDWATHMIGHEFSALYGIDHARSLALILPSLLRAQKKTKRFKLLQFAHRVWDIENGTTDEKIEKAITCTEDFFNSVGVPTKLKVYKLGEKEIDAVIKSLSENFPGNLGEHSDLDKVRIKELLMQAL